jgi:hypothetical protein
MIRLSDDGIIPLAIGMFGGCVVSVGPYTKTVSVGSAKDIAKMTPKDKLNAAKFVHKHATEFGFVGERTVQHFLTEYFSGPTET